VLYQLRKTITLAISLDEAWSFFSNPSNLPILTPSALRMTITSKPEARMYEGQLISYKLYPLLGIPMFWVSEITHVEEKKYFVDEQRHGPYKIWHHRHSFYEVNGGTAVEDVVDYMMPFGFLGRLFHALHVKNQLESIFDFRSKVLTSKFKSIHSDS